MGKCVLHGKYLVNNTVERKIKVDMLQVTHRKMTYRGYMDGYNTTSQQQHKQQSLISLDGHNTNFFKL